MRVSTIIDAWDEEYMQRFRPKKIIVLFDSRKIYPWRFVYWAWEIPVV